MRLKLGWTFRGIAARARARGLQRTRVSSVSRGRTRSSPSNLSQSLFKDIPTHHNFASNVLTSARANVGTMFKQTFFAVPVDPFYPRAYIFDVYMSAAQKNTRIDDNNISLSTLFALPIDIARYFSDESVIRSFLHICVNQRIVSMWYIYYRKKHCWREKYSNFFYYWKKSKITLCFLRTQKLDALHGQSRKNVFDYSDFVRERNKNKRVELSYGSLSDEKPVFCCFARTRSVLTA